MNFKCQCESYVDRQLFCERSLSRFFLAFVFKNVVGLWLISG